MEPIVIRSEAERQDLLGAIGETLRQIRVERELTLREVSAGSHVSLSYLAEIERGEKDPSSRVLQSVAEGLGMEASELLVRVAVTLDSSLAAPVAGSLAA